MSYAAGFPSAVAVADFNGDGKLDLALGSPLSNGLGVSVLLGNGNGTFQTAVNYNSGAVFGNTFAVGDFNGDGAPDLAPVYYEGVTLLLNTRGTRSQVTSSKNPSSLGNPVTFSALLQPSVRGSGRVVGAMTGTVTFRDGTVTLGTVTLGSSSLNLTTSGLATGRTRSPRAIRVTATTTRSPRRLSSR